MPKPLTKFHYLIPLLLIPLLTLSLLPRLSSKAAPAPTAVPEYVSQIGGNDGRFYYPSDITTDSSGNIYVADTYNNRIQKFDSSGTFLTKWGNSGTGNGEFNTPYGITTDSSGNIYVADTYNHRIQKFDSSGTFLTKWGKNGGDGSDGTGNGEFYTPAGITIDSSGNIYVADGGNNRIQKFDSSGTFLTKWGKNGGGDGTSGTGNGEFDNPRGITTDSSGNIYVADADNNRIQKFDSSGTFLTKWGKNGGDGTSGTGNGEFDNPRGITTDSSGNIYVVDSSNHRIQKFDSSGTFLTKWGKNGGDGSEGTGDGEFDTPAGITTDSSGNIYVADADNNRIQKFDANGNYISRIGYMSSDNGQLNYPYSSATDSSGNIYVVDSSNHRIQKFDANGTFLVKWGKNGGDGASGTGNGEFDTPVGITTDSSGNIYVVDSSNHRIQKFDSSGTFLTKWGKNGGDGSEGTGDGEFDTPAGITTDSSGNIYVADGDNNRIQKFDSSGTFLTKWGKNGGDGTSGTGNGEFDNPRGITTDSSGNIYVVDGGNHRIQKFDANGTFLTKWGKNGGDGTSGAGDGEFHDPFGIAIDSVGTIYVTDGDNCRIQKFDSSGNFLTKWGSLGYDEEEFYNPNGVTIDSSDNIYVTDTGNHRIQKFAYPDEDGTDNSIENSAPNSGDGNDDGIPDRLQPNVTSLVSTSSGKYITIETACTTNTQVQNSAESSSQDPSYDYPSGLVNFTATGCSSGSAITIKSYFYGSYDTAVAKLRKVSAGPASDITAASLTSSTIDSQPVTVAIYQVTDGGAYDSDGLANGSITDPVGLGIPASSVLGILPVTGPTIFIPFALALLTTFVYIVWDWRRHLKPLREQNPQVHYTLPHHIKVVTMPKVQYRLGLVHKRLPLEPISRR